MWQAKRRGSTEQTIAKAQKLKKELTPTTIKCNNCEAAIAEIEILESRPLNGVTGVYTGYCSLCNCRTIGMTGDPEKVRYYMEAFSKTIDADSNDLKLQANIRK
jgi:hypothetical protein